MTWGPAYVALLEECREIFERELAQERAAKPGRGRPRSAERRSAPRPRSRPLAERDAEICRRYTAGETAQDLARAFGIPLGGVRRVICVSRQRGVVVPSKMLRTHVPRHGTVNEYMRHGCRCGPCRKTYSAWHRSYEAAKRERRREMATWPSSKSA